MLAYGALYLETGTNIVIAVDPQTGQERWRFDPRIDRERHYAEVTSRGVSLWEDSALGAARTAVPATRVHGHPRCTSPGTGRRHRATLC